MLTRIKREQIIEAAKDIFLMKGVYKTRVEDITNHLGIAKGSFYTYFKTKDNLIESILDELYEIRKEELDDILKLDIEYRQKLKKFIIDGFITSPNRAKSHLILINLTKNLENLSNTLRDRMFKIKILNKEGLKKILEEIPTYNYSEEELKIISIYVIGGIRNYILERVFYKDKEQYFITDLVEFQNRVSRLEANNELELLIDRIVN